MHEESLSELLHALCNSVCHHTESPDCVSPACCLAVRDRREGSAKGVGSVMLK
jgi:hypothetical protein